MNTEKLFSGIAVIIDNEITNSGSAIYNIKNIIQSKNIPVSTFDDIPNIDTIPAFSNVSFIILDWDYFNNAFELSEEERISIPHELADTKEQELIEFITELLKKIFVPVFIFTAIDSETIVSKLRENGLWDSNKPNRIFVKQKTEVSSEADLFNSINGWLKAVPSVYVLKELENVISEAKNNLFLEMYGYSPNWVKIIWDMLKDDSIDHTHEFGEFVTRNLINRISEYNFDEELLNAEKTISPAELSKVVEGERYIEYNNQPAQAYTGDLFKKGGKYYLNIRAQCDLARTGTGTEYDPVLYCIKGEKLTNKDITTEDIRLTSEGEIVFSAKKRFSLDQLREICHNQAELPSFNNNFRKHRNGVFFNKGEILEKKLEVIVACIAGEQAIKFQTEIIPLKFGELKEQRKGRVLPPYITRIQQKCAQSIVREGVMPIPKELFATFED